MHRLSLVFVLAVAILSPVSILRAQNNLLEAWRSATELPGVDLTGLSGARKELALKILRDRACPCGCKLMVAECRVKDPSCSYSTALAGLIVRNIEEGKSEAEIEKIIAASPLGKTRKPLSLLEEPVKIPIENAPAKGPANARITIVEFSDFECPYCARAAGQVGEVMKAYPNDIRLVYKQFPLSFHPNALLAATASMAAQEQGKFWQLHDRMFANFRALSRENVLTWAKEAGVDVAKFTADLDSGKYKQAIEKDLRDGEGVGVSGTPSFFINGKHLNGPLLMDVLKPVFEEELKTAAK